MAHPARPPHAAHHRRRVAWVLVVAFVVVPLVEIVLLVQVGQVVGAWWTILLLLASGVVGGWLVRREGGRAWRALSAALSSGRMPRRELADGALVLVGGTLMLTPGFATDLVGLLLVLPPTRPTARRLLAALVGRRLAVVGDVGRPRAADRHGPDAPRPGDQPGGRVVRGEVVDD